MNGWSLLWAGVQVVIVIGGVILGMRGIAWVIDRIEDWREDWSDEANARPRR